LFANLHALGETAALLQAEQMVAAISNAPGRFQFQITQKATRSPISNCGLLLWWITNLTRSCARDRRPLDFSWTFFNCGWHRCFSHRGRKQFFRGGTGFFFKLILLVLPTVLCTNFSALVILNDIERFFFNNCRRPFGGWWSWG
jgi:RNase P subunit RPR2